MANICNTIWNGNSGKIVASIEGEIVYTSDTTRNNRILTSGN